MSLVSISLFLLIRALRGPLLLSLGAPTCFSVASSLAVEGLGTLWGCKCANLDVGSLIPAFLPDQQAMGKQVKKGLERQ